MSECKISMEHYPGVSLPWCAAHQQTETGCWKDQRDEALRKLDQMKGEYLAGGKEVDDLREKLRLTNLQVGELLKAMKEIAAIPPTGDGALMKAQNIADEACALKRNCDLCATEADCPAITSIDAVTEYECTRAKGHAGKHVACGEWNHNMFSWET